MSRSRLAPLLLLAAFAVTLMASSCARRQFSPPTYYQVAPGSHPGGSK